MKFSRIVQNPAVYTTLSILRDKPDYKLFIVFYIDVVFRIRFILSINSKKVFISDNAVNPSILKHPTDVKIHLTFFVLQNDALR